MQARPVIVESEEPLLPLEEHGRLRVMPVYAQIGYAHALPDVLVRRDVARRLREASDLLPHDLTLIALDGWRPFALQDWLYREYRRRVMRRSGLVGQELEDLVAEFVDEPSLQPARPSDHFTGGTVAVMLGDPKGSPLHMGAKYDELADPSITGFYEAVSDDDAQGALYRGRRRLLCAVMAYTGFSNRPSRWWQFDTGNQAHHARVGGPARYGLILGQSPSARLEIPAQLTDELLGIDP